MAEKGNFQRKQDVFWANLDMDSSGEDAYIPGISAPGNKRPSRIKARKTKEVKPKIPISQPVVEDVSSSPDCDLVAKQQKRSRVHKPKPRQEMPKKVPVNLSCDSERSDNLSGDLESFMERSIRRLNQASASLKDLRPEDKQRVANLIKELAKVGDEKEKVVRELHGERETHEKQILTLVEQQEKILTEREDIQDKLFQCQQLLTEYQSQLLNKQDKLNTSIASIRETCKPSNNDKKKVIAQEIKVEHKNTEEMKKVIAQEIKVENKNKEETKVVDAWEMSSLGLDRDLTPILDVTPFVTQVQRQSRSRESPHDLQSHGRYGEDNDSVTDLLLQNKNPEDNVKRPYTSLIDKEIARERSLSRSSRGSVGSRSRSGSPLDGRPRFMYPPKLNGIGPLSEPVASSTHKSMEIRQNLPEHDLDSPRSSLRGSSVRGQSPVDRGHQSRVVFNERTEVSDNAKMHSPNLKNPKMFNDPRYAQYYKKLSPTGRKRELLSQRQSLLDEQERLRGVLEKQEKALQLRQYEYDKRVELQKERMDFYKEGGKFPALRLDFDGDSQSETRVNVNIETVADEEVVGGANLQGGGRLVEEMDVGRATPEDIEIDDETQIKGRISASTSPMVTPKAQKISMATSPSLPEEDFRTPRFIDAATSISYRTPLKDASNRQGNLPLQSNRQKTSPYTKQPVVIRHETSPYTKQTVIIRHEEEAMTRTPGEKTLNVLELVNSMEERPPSLNNSYTRPDIENKPVGVLPMRQPAGKHPISKGTHSSPYRQYGSQSTQRTSHDHRMDKEISLEENKILEDIFFLK